MAAAARFREFTSFTYIEQAKAFLNAYWHEYQNDAESVWDWTHQFITLDHEKGKEGCDLDEFNAHRFLEKLGETRTIKDLRDELRDIDMDFNKRMALVEYLLFHYRKTISDFIARPQGDNTEELMQAQSQLDQAQAALELSKAAYEHAVVEAEKSALAEAELKAALADLHEQERAYTEKTQQLTTRSSDQSLGVVQRNKAANELAQHLGEDPLPLRRAKLTTEAATKKAERAAILAEQAKLESEEKARECEEKFDEAQRFLEELRSRPGGGQGALWWIDRELTEARKYMPKRRQ
jgi:DNA repair exonuclease SbcCD ATPase subunit